LLEREGNRPKEGAAVNPEQKWTEPNSIHFHKLLIFNDLTLRGLACGRRVRIRLGRKILVQRGRGGAQNELAIGAGFQMALNVF